MTDSAVSQRPRLLPASAWQTKYSPEHGDLVQGFYVPALKYAIR